MKIFKIISGGQTGVDRAALDAATHSGIPVGGWCPRGRRAEDGKIPESYPLLETPSDNYAQRTEWNVRDSDATLILYRSAMTGGTLFTGKTAAKYGRPCRCVDLEKEALETLPFKGEISVLNIAGPRESEAPGIHEEVFALLLKLLGE